MRCDSVRTKLRRWLRRASLPRNQYAWYCARISDGRRLCSAGNGGGAPHFTFRLTRSQGSASPVTRIASRPATETERAELAAAFGVPPECIDATISTADQQWAFFFPTNIPSCPQANGYVVLRHEVTGWQVQYQGSAVEACPLGSVPTPVARDLGLCRKPRTYIMCQPRGRFSERILRRHPARCNSLGPGQALAQAVNLARLRWRGWGRRVARARGIERGFHLPLARIPVRVKAYRRRLCPSGDFLYTRLKATSRYGSLLVRYPASCSD